VGLRAHPDELVQSGTLLSDLRYRLGHCIVTFPPLCERREDITPMALVFLQGCEEETGVPGPKGFAADTLPALEAAAWPGNARDLRAAIVAAYLHAQNEELIDPSHLPGCVGVPRFVAHGDGEVNQQVIAWALWRTDGHVAAAARLLGVHRNTVSAYVARRRSHSSSESSVPNA
jgi:DNA-binding NtrC family response regulator